ncbi:DHH family phosphoesterase [Salinirussus salinus]|jgi:nanoRNase/pAp phosphatase (c-di-AMP/oligoRNAs hydrolase)|uniref:DHH family phosphoesterase n=1 Tax=Salinirussus salinus TaxID=1198300 RepID=UPI0037441CC6
MGVMVAVPDVWGAFDAASALAADRPLVVAGVAVVLVVLLAVGAVALRRYLRPTGERFADLVGGFEEVTVLMHPNPDPDAMSCALAVKHLAESGDTEATLQYPGQIRHQENRAFETVLDASFERIDSASDLDDGEVVLVDHNEPRGFSGAERVDPVAVVDHHPGGGEGREFTDVRTDNGSCASIFAEYFRETDWEPADPEENGEAEEGELSPAVATGLLYGIQSDTNQLTKGCSPAEFDAARYLYPGVDEDHLDRIANPEVDAEVLEVKATAITEREVRNAFAVSDVGTVSNVDAIPQAADELLRLEGVTAVVVLGDKDGQIHLSGRSRDDRVHMGKALSAVVEDVPMGGAGGHARMGGGQLSIEHMNGLGPGDGLTREQFHERLFEAMSGEL